MHDDRSLNLLSLIICTKLHCNYMDMGSKFLKKLWCCISEE